MRLINVHTRKINDFLSDTDVQRYAILSHTWGLEEVSFEEYQCLPKETLMAKKGYAKIDYCCLQASADGLDWAWVDTCCIDKRSSAELSEAINSMFRWYRQSAVCYAYLADVYEADPANVKIDVALARARWFTRGWTLQELLAPPEMELYAHGWKRIGTRTDICGSLSKITGIEVKYLCGLAPLEEASVAKRMYWAARRETTRTEDIAYCLLGLFDVNMPLLYGEGRKAFRRLQEEIMKTNPTDHTLFAW
ncbi:HET-domain-containing protein, partial [Parathielavia appendiculata]